MKLPYSVAVTLAICSNALLTSAGRVQGAVQLPPSASSDRDSVRKLFTDSYQAYKDFAFGHDDVSPISQTFSDGRNGWGASIADAMSTMHIMGLTDLFNEAVDFASKIDFSRSQTPSTVSVFETSIRYLGGLLSAYELSDKRFPALLEKAQQVADKMAFAWVDNNAIPFGFLNFSTNSPTRANSNIAEAGTLSLEWETLTKYTSNQTYANLAIGALEHIANLSHVDDFSSCMQAAPLPGLAAQGINPATGQFVGGYVTWGGGSDSYFEYLIKHARLSNTNNNIFADTWHTAVDSSIKNLLKTSTVGNQVYLADFDSTRQIRHIGSHLACFYGGNWLLGGKLMDNQTIVDIGLQLTDSCWNTYASTATGIGPEVFAYISADGSFTGGGSPSPDQLNFYAEHGFYITASDYILRPEVLESNFYAYRVTGDQKYYNRAVSAVQSFNKFLTVSGGGVAGLGDVNNVNSGKIDDTESFWFAEVLKYLFLTFDDPGHISLDDYVFNTEAHPFRAPAAKSSYGTGKIHGGQPFKPQHGAPAPAISPNPTLPTPLQVVINTNN
ncbi:glycoside hydrolase family 47 protein [Amanita thiersii Skay4041]|uniref:alpha-1,2-Mannosidase n=1 Tax=Amanita thiersii Skay4041 TaxID=703135 RepID=A0A2A9NFB5_9AGAR|nr:glycoside hydrolase family 47 protein [Amanita thiersii Skay4041]